MKGAWSRMVSVEVVGPGLDSEHILKLELMRFVDGLRVREINEPKFLT